MTTLVLALLGGSGCSRQATIHTDSGAVHRTEITGRDAQYTYVRKDGKRYGFYNSEIAAIEHPGETAYPLGLALTICGLLSLTYSATQPERSFGRGVGAAGAILTLMPGLPLLMWGAGVNRKSREALEKPPAKKGGAEP